MTSTIGGIHAILLRYPAVLFAVMLCLLAGPLGARAQPEAPTVTVSTTETSVTLSWNAVAGAGAGATGYEYQELLITSSAPVSLGNVTTVTITGLRSATPYGFVVTAISGDQRTDSNLNIAITKPEAPSNLRSFCVSGTVVDLVWNASPDGPQFNPPTMLYEARIDSGSWKARNSGRARRFQNLSLNTSYTFGIRALVSSVGVTAFSDVTSIDITTAAADVAIPTNLQISDITFTSLKLTWTASTGTVTAYEVSVNGVDWVDSGGDTEHVFSGLQPGRAYTMRVRAKNDNAVSCAATSASANTLPPSLLTATKVAADATGTKVAETATQVAANATGTKVAETATQVSANATGTKVAETATQVSANATGTKIAADATQVAANATGTKVAETATQVSANATGTKIAADATQVSANATGTKIAADATQVSANATGTKIAADATQVAANATGTKISADATAAKIAADALLSSAELTATEAAARMTGTSNAMTATQVSANATGTKVAANATGTKISADATQVAANATGTKISADATQVAANATGTKISADATASKIAADAEEQEPVILAPPEPPSGLSAGNVDTHSVTVNWDKSDNASSYEVQAYEDPEQPQSQTVDQPVYPNWINVGDVDSYTYSSLSPGVQYIFAVHAINSLGASTDETLAASTLLEGSGAAGSASGGGGGSDDGESGYTPVPRTLDDLLPDIVVRNWLLGAQGQRVEAWQLGAPSLESDFVDGVDIWGYITPGIEVCFRRYGMAMVFLDAASSPRTQSPLNAYYSQGMVCAIIDSAGTVVLLDDDSEVSPTASPSPRKLSDCMVETQAWINFRAAPLGDIIYTLAPGISLTAEEYAGGWYKVDFYGQAGWLSADYVLAEGSC